MPSGSQPPRPSTSSKTKKLTAGRKAWHRQDGETLDAYEAFMAYLMLPADQRSQVKAAAAVGKSHSLINRWSYRWSWLLRTAAYEEHYLLLRLESIEADKDEMWSDQQRMARMAMQIVEGNFDQLLGAMAKAKEDGTEGLSVKTDALVRLFDTASKIQRMAVLGRVASAADAQEKNEALAERYAEELAQLMEEVQRETGLTPEQHERFKSVVQRHLVGDSE